MKRSTPYGMYGQLLKPTQFPCASERRSSGNEEARPGGLISTKAYLSQQRKEEGTPPESQEQAYAQKNRNHFYGNRQPAKASPTRLPRQRRE